jgi:hypothetical protein
MRFRVAVCCFLLGSCLLISAQGVPPSAQASSRSHKKTIPVATAPLAGATADGVYHNPFFGFSYKFPFGWVDRSDTMKAGDEAEKSMALLAVFERPPEVTAEEINSGVVIAAESVSSYPGLKTAADYFGPVREVAEAKGFKVENDPYEFSAGGKQVVRQDFRNDKGYQASLAWLSKGYVVSATFIGENEDDVQELIEDLKFTRQK